MKKVMLAMVATMAVAGSVWAQTPAEVRRAKQELQREAAAER